MSAETFPAPRELVLSWADTQALTVLEQARACVLAGIRPANADRLMRAYASGEAEPEELLEGALLFYAVALQLELRRDPGATWEDAQRWRVTIDAGEPDPMIAAEARARVETSIATGVPLERAGDLTMAEVQAYNDVHADAEKARRRRAPRGRRP